MRFFETKKAFTLMEVNLAIFIMAVGLLAMVALYPLAYRESRQSKDDVKAAAAADCILNSLAAALSSRNIKWSEWESGINSAINATGVGHEGRGWLDYCEKSKNSYVPKTRSGIKSKRDSVFNALAGINSKHKPSWPVDDELVCAIVAQWGQMPVYDGSVMNTRDDHSRVSISLRVARRAGELMGQPIFYTEVHFQGDQKDLKN